MRRTVRSARCRFRPVERRGRAPARSGGPMTEIHGTCAEGFEAARDAFASNFDQGLETGASAYVTIDGEPVLDVWAGDADTAGRPWERDTIVNVWSTTKTMAAVVMLHAADHQLIDLE